VASDKPTKVEAAPLQVQDPPLVQKLKEQALQGNFPIEQLEQLDPNAITPRGMPTVTDMKARQKGLGALVTAFETPQVADLLVALGNDILGIDPRTDPLTQFVSNLSQDERAQEVANALREGRPEDQRFTRGLDPDRRRAVEAQFNQEQQQATADRRTDLAEESQEFREAQVLAELGISQRRTEIAAGQLDARQQEIEFAKEAREARQKIDEEIAQVRKQNIMADTLLTQTRTQLAGAQAEEEKETAQLAHVRMITSFLGTTNRTIELNEERIAAMESRIRQETFALPEDEREEAIANHPPRS
jgi:hypothetical protein